jgi:hypothetical protein
LGIRNDGLANIGNLGKGKPAFGRKRRLLWVDTIKVANVAESELDATRQYRLL